MVKVTVIGSGNVAQHLIAALKTAEGIELAGAFARDAGQLSHLLDADKIISDYNLLQDSDLYIISVSDNAIAEVADQLPFDGKLVVHTSGSVAVDALPATNRRGVFYPLQTFSKNKPLLFDGIPVCLEAEQNADMELLKKVALAISKNVHEIDSDQRKSLHIAAVFVNNFVNHLYQIGNKICDENAVSFEILKPLILETANKIMTLSPSAAQTGPAKRNDSETINAHLKFLSDPTQKEIYKIFTKSIIDHGKKL